MDKFEKDGKVAILYSPGYGAGWYTWNSECEGLLFDPELVRLVLEGDLRTTAKRAEEKYGSEVYAGGADGLKVCWLPKGSRFKISDHDGFEIIETVDDLVMVA